MCHTSVAVSEVICNAKTCIFFLHCLHVRWLIFIFPRSRKSPDQNLVTEVCVLFICDRFSYIYSTGNAFSLKCSKYSWLVNRLANSAVEMKNFLQTSCLLSGICLQWSAEIFQHPMYSLCGMNAVTAL
jgi:hypothetical protein